MAGLHQLLSKLNIDEGRRRGDDPFSEELKCTELSPFFDPLTDLGYFSWEPSGAYKSLGSIKSCDEILRYIDLVGKPDNLKPIQQIDTPKRFVSPPSTAYKNKFPYGEVDVACIYVAVKVNTNIAIVTDCNCISALFIACTMISTPLVFVALERC